MGMALSASVRWLMCLLAMHQSSGSFIHPPCTHKQTVRPSCAEARHGVNHGLRSLWVSPGSEDSPDPDCVCGLLEGVAHPANATFYSMNMDRTRAAEMVSDRGIVYEAAKLDVKGTNETVGEYLREITGKASAFLEKDEVVNRRALVDTLNTIVEGAGHFVCLLGGKSTGKSLLLRDLSKRYQGKVFVVNLRRYKSILGGLVRILPQQLSLRTWAVILASIFGAARGASSALPEGLDRIMAIIKGAVPNVDDVEQGSMFLERASRAAVQLLSELRSSPADDADPLSIVVNIMENNLGHMTIVVDEANLAFNKRGSEEETREALELFTTLTKEERKINVILVSSEHAFPFGLARKEIGFNLDNLTRFLYAGEVPPKDMYELLTEKWGVGRHLALALLAHFGGHVWETYQALVILSEGEIQAYDVGLDVSKGSCVQECLAWRPQRSGWEWRWWTWRDADVQRRRMREALQLLATRGFAPLPARGDKVAEVISLNNVGGVVRRGALVAGLPREAWGNAKYGLVPATQSMRLAIAEQLVEEASGSSGGNETAS